MKKLFKATVLIFGCLLIAGSASAQWTLFTVEEGAIPNGTTYPTLAQAIATAETYAGGPHKIMIKAGNYNDVGLTPNGLKVGEIYGDPEAAVGDIVFNGGSNFMALDDGMTVSHFTVTGYDDAFQLNDDQDCTIDDVVMDDNVRGVVMWNAGTHDNAVTNCLFTGNTSYGIQVYSSAEYPNTFEDNCFVNSPLLCDRANLTWNHNYHSNDDASRFYIDIPGAGLCTDDDPWRHENLATGPATGEFGTIVRVYFDWTVPECTDVQDLAAYDFTARWNAAKVTYVPGSFWPTNDGFLGPDDTQDGDAVYAFDASDAGIGRLHFAGANFTTPTIGEGTLAYADFEVIDALTNVNFYTESDYRDGNNDPIPVPGAPTYLTMYLDDTEPPVMGPIDVCANDPTGTGKYSKGSLAGPGPFVPLHFIGMNCTDNHELASIEWSIDGSAWNPWFNTTPTVTYLDGDREFHINVTHPWPFEGAASAYVRAVDAANNESDPVQYDFVIDRSCTTPTLELADKGCAFFDGYTAEETVGYTLTGADADVGDMRHRDLPWIGWTAPELFVAAGDYLLVGEGNHTVQFQLYDDVGNRSGTAGDVMRLDQIPPVAAGPMLINGGALKTSDENVTITITNHGGSDAIMAILTEAVEDPTPCVLDGWFNKYDNATTTSMPYVLDPVEDGLHLVQFWSADSAGNMSASVVKTSILWDDITLDTTPPGNITVLIEDLTPPDLGGEDCSDNHLVKVTVSWDDDGDVVRIYLDHDGHKFPYGDWSTPMPSPQELSFNMNHCGHGPVSGTDVTITADLRDNSVPRNIGYGEDNIWLDYTNPPLTGAVMTDQDGATGPAGNAIHPQYSNDVTVTLTVTGLTDDCEELWVSSDSWTNWQVFDVTGIPPAVPYDLVYEYDGPPPLPLCGYSYIDVRSVDCAANQSVVQSDGIIIDAVAPDITAFSGPPVTNNLTVALTITATDDCSAFVPYQMRITEEGSSVTPTWQSWGSWTGTFDLEDKSLLDPVESNTGDRTLHLEVADRAGNVTATSAIIKDGETVPDIVIEVDVTAPEAGEFDIVSANPLAAPGYTDSRWSGGNDCVFTPVDDDVTLIQIISHDVSWNTGPVPAVSPITVDGTFGPPGVGEKTLRYRYWDEANNVSDWYPATVWFDPVAAPTPTNATAQQGGSVLLEWDDMDVQYYHIRSNFAGGYPEYADVVALGPPPHPATFGQGIFVAEPVAPSHSFTGPQPDLYAISVWSLSNAGKWSLLPNVQILVNDYIKGDVSDDLGTEKGDPDGCLSFDPEFVYLAASYWTSVGDAAFDPYMDIAPTACSGGQEDYSLPDGNVDFEDLILFALNYRDERCSKKDGASSDRETVRQIAVASSLTVTAELPAYSRIGNEFSVPISISDGEGVAGYHLVFDYDHSALEFISVQPGDVYERQDRSFFYHDADAESIDISSVILSGEFEAGEIAVVTFRSRVTGPVTLKDKLLDVRDWNNQKAEVEFSLVAKTGSLPTEYSLSQNYPNPFNPTTTIELALPEACQYRLTVYNIIGQVVETFEGHADAGFVTLNWNASGHASGLYLYRVTAGSFTATRKMVLLK